MLKEMADTFLCELFGISGKTAIVTGAASGIGHGIARFFAKAGARVIIADRAEERAELAAAELRSSGAESIAIQTDVSDERSVKEMIARAAESFGSVDILINDAGIFPIVPLAKMALHEWERVQAINLRGAFLCLREAALRMREQQRGGRIINISSIDSLHPSAIGLAHYDASKGGLNMLTRSAALEFGPDKITVNAILPGLIATEGAEAATKTLGSSMETFNRRIVLGRIGSPEDIAGAALFLASKAASYVTGELLVVDGGYLIG